jgi:predicted ATPase
MDSVRIVGGRFEILGLIRRGGVGEVYHGIDRQTGEKVAIKQLKTDVFGEDPDSVQRFIREGDALRALNHPSIVKIVATVEDTNRHYLVMEYLPGGSLGDLLRREGRLPVKQTVLIALDLADALTRAHRLRIIHRDIKPDNVLLASDGTPRLTDFGLARLDSSTITQSGIMVGTYNYLAPEAFNGQMLDARADIWAFGVMLFQMLTGHVPFSGETPGAIMLSVLTRPTPDLEAERNDLPVSLIDLIYRMLEKNPNQRVQSMRQIGAELEMVLRTADNNNQPTSSVYNRSIFAATPALSQVALIPNNLPPQPTPFVGREHELEELTKTIGTPGNRLITVLGPGGMGKTRLALELGERQLIVFADGVYFVPLAPVNTPEWIVSAIADAVSFTFYDSDSPKKQVLNYLREKRLLLILDNFEHLMNGVDIINDILQVAPHVKIMVTSRERLSLQGEAVFSIEGMAYPTQIDEYNLPLSDFDATPATIEDYAAVKLFIQCARRQQSELVLSETDLRYVARICQLVQGMPLGIELATSWIETLPLPEIVVEIERSFDFLETEMRDVPIRQRSIRAVFEYTWNLLTPAEKSVFTYLSIFRGGFSRDAAQHVANASLKSLMHLINKSLLRRFPDGRYQIHELLRQYAETRLMTDPQLENAIRTQHSAYYLNFVAARSSRLKIREQTSALAEIETELGNIRAAWDYALLHQNAEAIYPALESLWNFHIYCDRLQEGEDLFRRTVEALHRLPPIGKNELALGFAQILHSVLAHRTGNEALSQQHLEEGTALLNRIGARRERAIADIWNTTGTTETIIARMQSARETLEQLNDRWGVATAYLCLGAYVNFYGDWRQARQYLLNSLEIAHAIGDPLGQAGALGSLGWNCFQTGDYEEGHHYFDEARKLYRQTETPGGVASMLSGMGTIDWLRGQFNEAERYLRESLEAYQKLGSRWGIGSCLSGLGVVAWRRGRPEDAIEPIQRAIAIYRELGVPRSVSNALVNLGHPLVDLGRDQDALKTFREALSIAVETGAILQTLESLAGIGAVYGYAAREVPALQLLSFAYGHPSVSAEVRGIAERYMIDLDWQIKMKLAADQIIEVIEQGRMLTLDEAVTIANHYPAEMPSPLFSMQPAPTAS